MKLRLLWFAAVVILLFTCTLAVNFTSQAQTQQSVIIAYTITGLEPIAKQAGDYSAVVSTDHPRSYKAPIPNNGDSVLIHTRDCDHVPAKGETGTLLINLSPAQQQANATRYNVQSIRLLFSGGMTCKVSDLAVK